MPPHLGRLPSIHEKTSLVWRAPRASWGSTAALPPLTAPAQRRPCGTPRARHPPLQKVTPLLPCPAARRPLAAAGPQGRRCPSICCVPAWWRPGSSARCSVSMQPHGPIHQDCRQFSKNEYLPRKQQQHLTAPAPPAHTTGTAHAICTASGVKRLQMCCCMPPRRICKKTASDQCYGMDCRTGVYRLRMTEADTARQRTK